MPASAPGLRVVLGAFASFVALLAAVGWAVYAGTNAGVDAATTRLTVRLAVGREVTVRLPEVDCRIRPNGGIVIRNTPRPGVGDQIAADYVHVSSRYGVTITGSELVFSSVAPFAPRGDEVLFDALPGTATITANGPPIPVDATLTGALACTRE
ncbi:hypothetical protein [Leifsonia sp. NPDC080035]|uniref:Uncharacterized protein n=1 Tax=Leifsonia sp. NPDC080035 TaxID=3143936 RepID=A0AAU7GDG4_9MICO